ncbi:MAG: hypothetical protein J6K33_03465 [Alistipes sp.]|nr:hypothetical protein [Alistipes sp.]
MSSLKLTYADGRKIEIIANNIVKMTSILNDDYVAKTRIELNNGDIELVVETIDEINKM